MRTYSQFQGNTIMSKVKGITVSPEVKLWLFASYKVLVTSRGFIIQSKSNPQQELRKPTWGDVMLWARNERVRTMKRASSIHTTSAVGYKA